MLVIEKEDVTFFPIETFKWHACVIEKEDVTFVDSTIRRFINVRWS